MSDTRYRSLRDEQRTAELRPVDSEAVALLEIEPDLDVALGDLVRDEWDDWIVGQAGAGGESLRDCWLRAGLEGSGRVVIGLVPR